MSLVDVSEAYDQGARDYDSAMRQDHWMRRLIWRQFAEAFEPGDDVLDLGCGTGIDSHHLLQRGMKVTALDASAEMLRRLERKLAAKKQDITFVQGDLKQLDTLQPDRFDGVVSSFAALNTLDDWPQWQQQVQSILKPRGQLVIHMLNAGDIWHTAERRRQTQRDILLHGHPVRHYFHSATALYQHVLAENFDLAFCCQLSFLLPYGKRYQLPAGINRILGEIEYRLGRLSMFDQTGRFVLMRLLKKS